ncbi:hypothetical protein OS175_12770 [Marinicella sp. S1101]|uniref:hypothetical protein n=1 Tax=Marinicella marina TaxID=2996016 RepID=UPI002260ED79|nr:hypothetical protein [Marinicella marina]MCX7554747.1 hypothetical protein [Marinicella marina]MDJ1141437.1 hypothetical protein [Marinicella marina]
MLLRRITEHVKDQNWFAVFLDFLIVVVGVFIGIQVANWNAERQNQAKAEFLVDRLYEEVKDVEVKLQMYIETHKNILKQRTQFALAVQDKQACSNQIDKMKESVLSVGDFPPPRFSLPIATQALNTGELAIITADTLRDEVQNTTDEMQFLSRQWQRYIKTVQEVEKLINTQSGLAINSGRDKPLYSTEPYSLDRYELLSVEKLCNNTEIIGSLSGVEVLQQIYVAYMLEIQTRLNQYLNTLKGYQS